MVLDRLPRYHQTADILFPSGIATVFADASVVPEPLRPEEEQVIAKAVEKRRREFALGRTCARSALARLGAGAPTIPSRADRSPVWPDGIVGAITHCEGLAAAAVGWRTEWAGIGLDAELSAPPLETRIARLICTPQEEASLSDRPQLPHTDWLRLIFSAKEVVYKATAPYSGVRLGFHDVELDFDIDGGTFSARCHVRDDRLGDLSALRGRFVISPDFVLSSAFVPAEAVRAHSTRPGR